MVPVDFRNLCNNLIKKFGLIEKYVRQIAGLKDIFQLLKNCHFKRSNIFLLTQFQFCKQARSTFSAMNRFCIIVDAMELSLKQINVPLNDEFRNQTRAQEMLDPRKTEIFSRTADEI